MNIKSFEIRNRLFVGTGKYASYELMQKELEASGCQVVTVAVDNLDFLYPIKVGEHVVLRAHMTRAFRTSMEVEVRVYREDYLTGERQQTSSAFVTYVALDPQGNPHEVPPLIVTTREEKRRFREALGRRRLRLALAAQAHRRYFEKA